MFTRETQESWNVSTRSTFSDYQISGCVWDPGSFHREERQPSWESSLRHRERNWSGARPDSSASPLNTTLQTQG